MWNLVKVLQYCYTVSEENNDKIQYTYPSFPFTHWNHFDDRVI